MSINKLPPEILAQALDWLGSPFFREDVTRLAVSKKWYALARPVLFQALTLDESSLHDFAGKIRAHAADSVAIHVVEINMRFQGFPYGYGTASPGQSEIFSSIFAHSVSQLNGDLGNLARALHRFTKLRRISLTAGRERRGPGPPRAPYLERMAVVGAVCAENITSLDIDTAGSQLSSEPSEIHPCKVIRETLKSLRRLRIRSIHICPVILMAPTSLDERQSLEDVIVNLSISNMTAHDLSYRHSTYCQRTDVTATNLIEAMEFHAELLVESLVAPKLVRVISHTLPGLETRAFDAITRRRLKLPDTTQWGASGEVIEEVGIDSEETEISDVDILIKIKVQ